MAHRVHQRRARRVGFPVLLIITGIYLLLYNLEVIDWHPLAAAATLWPLLLITIGLDLVMVRAPRVLAAAVTVVVLGGLLTLGVLGKSWCIGGATPAGPPQEITIAGDGVESANLKLRFYSGDLLLQAAAQEMQELVKGTAYTTRQPDLSVTETRDGSLARLQIRNRGRGLMAGPIAPFGIAHNQRLDLDLHREIPFTLAVEGIGAALELDLREVRLESMELDLTGGNATVRLPDPTAELSCDLDVDLGSVLLEIPETAAARIRVSADLSSISIGRRFTKRSSRVWESAGFNDAEQRWSITVRSDLGSLRVR